jgi:hypothetical protein
MTTCYHMTIPIAQEFLFNIRCSNAQGTLEYIISTCFQRKNNSSSDQIHFACCCICSDAELRTRLRTCVHPEQNRLSLSMSIGREEEIEICQISETLPRMICSFICQIGNHNDNFCFDSFGTVRKPTRRFPTSWRAFSFRPPILD